MVSACITTDDPAAQTAAKWLRDQNKVPKHSSIIPQFEEQFNCSVAYTDIFGTGKIYFKTEQDLIWFLLKWS